MNLMIFQLISCKSKNKYYLSLLKIMGGQPSKIKSEEYMTNLSEGDRSKLKNSANKPSQEHAIPNQHPEISQKTKELLNNYSNSSDSDKNITGEKLPCYELLKMPGCFYDGEWQNGQQHGQGMLYTSNGLVFKGKFKGGVAECQKGIMVFPDGSYYEGQISNNGFNGKGKFISSQVTYDGEWKNNRPDGQGTEIFKDTSTYTGNFKLGKKDQKGVFTWLSNNKKYDGYFKNGEMHGRGILSIPSSGSSQNVSSNFEGRFENGLKVTDNGKVDIRTPYGMYKGSLKNGELSDPMGVFQWNDGRKYTGEFQYGEFHKKGEISMPEFEGKQGNWNYKKEISHILQGEWNYGENISLNMKEKH